MLQDSLRKPSGISSGNPPKFLQEILQNFFRKSFGISLGNPPGFLHEILQDSFRKSSGIPSGNPPGLLQEILQDSLRIVAPGNPLIISWENPLGFLQEFFWHALRNSFIFFRKCNKISFINFSKISFKIVFRYFMNIFRVSFFSLLCFKLTSNLVKIHVHEEVLLITSKKFSIDFSEDS